MAIEILCACVAGAARSVDMGSMYNFDRTQNTGFVIGAFDISKIVDMEAYRESVSRLFDDIKASPKIEGIPEIFIPGEIEDRRYAQAEAEGLELSDAVAGELRDIADELGLSFDCLKDM